MARATDGPMGIVESGVHMLAIVLARFVAEYDEEVGALISSSDSECAAVSQSGMATGAGIALSIDVLNELL